MKRIYYLLVFGVIGLLFGCQNVNGQIPEEFWAFREKFYADSLYQVEHIDFPLAGIDIYEMGYDESVYIWETPKDLGFLKKGEDYGLSVNFFACGHFIEEYSIAETWGVLLLFRKNRKGTWTLIRYENFE